MQIRKESQRKNRLVGMAVLKLCVNTRIMNKVLEIRE